MPHQEITFINTPEETNNILIALLSESGFEGFEENAGHLRGYVPTEVFDKQAMDSLAAQYQFDYSENEIHDTNWSNVWESNFQPVVVDNFCSIRADFHTPAAQTEHEVVITPKMSFGTGHHATTFMMITQMQDIDFHNKTVLDFGTGTGVLAILAQKLGASSVIAIDNDDWSIANAAENFHRNETKNVTLQKADTADVRQQFNIILANITRNVIADNFNLFSGALVNNGVLLLSGLLQEDEEYIIRKASEYNFRLDKKLLRDNWVSLRFSR